jgi:hypothetical protein
MSTEAQLPSTPAATMNQSAPMGAAASSALFRLAVDYHDARDRCMRTGGANIDELMDLLADGATWTVVVVTSLTGKAAIREMYLARAARYQQGSEIRGIELCGDLVICHSKRRDPTFVEEGRERQIRLLLVKGGKIQQVIVVFDPEAFARLRGGSTVAAKELEAIRALGDREQEGMPPLAT